MKKISDSKLGFEVGSGLKRSQSKYSYKGICKLYGAEEKKTREEEIKDQRKIVKDLETKRDAKSAEWRLLPHTGKGSYRRMVVGNELRELNREVDEAKGKLFKLMKEEQ